MVGDEQLVSVIIPAYNAQATIAETLDSVLAQTHTNLEIIVVDDGSHDETVNIVQSFASRHPQIQLIRQANAGVAAARNTAIAAAEGAFIAPIDADDLWHPKRLELHLKALQRSNLETAVAYSPFYVIDPQSRVCGQSTNFNRSGNVFYDMLKQNLVGNGSGLFVRTDALRHIGGYSSRLRELGAQGCEDYLAQLHLAYYYEFVCVPEYLIGYRIYAGNMSSDKIKMLRSEIFMHDMIREAYPIDQKAHMWAKMGTMSRLVPRVLKRLGARALLKEVRPHISSYRTGLCLTALTIKYLITKAYLKLLYFSISQAIKLGIRKQRDKLTFYQAIASTAL